jgi:hypothetical protein
MPHEIKFAMLPGGYAAESSRAGAMLPVIVREFTSSEDGNRFIARLEGLPRDIIAMLPGHSFNREATVDHLLAIVRPDCTATVYLDDLPFTLLVRAKRALNAGDPVTLDHILDVTKVKLGGIVVPPDAGVIVVLSAGWRKGFFFDLGPLHGEKRPRDYDLESLLGQYYAYLHFQAVFSLTDANWSAFFQQGWFPFNHLKQATIRTMIEWTKAGFALDDQLDTIAAEVRKTVATHLPAWKNRALFAGHHELIAAAYQRFTEDDFISATAILFPRIEGVLRAHHRSASAPAPASQGNLAASTLSRAQLPAHGNSLLLPERFRRYLEEVYFASFDPSNPTALNRNTIAHGVAPQSAFDRKAATIGFLILLQLAALLPADATPPAPAP